MNSTKKISKQLVPHKSNASLIMSGNKYSLLTMIIHFSCVCMCVYVCVCVCVCVSALVLIVSGI